MLGFLSSFLFFIVPVIMLPVFFFHFSFGRWLLLPGFFNHGRAIGPARWQLQQQQQPERGGSRVVRLVVGRFQTH
jgi:hypothetical protein